MRAQAVLIEPHRPADLIDPALVLGNRFQAISLEDVRPAVADTGNGNFFAGIERRDYGSPHSLQLFIASGSGYRPSVRLFDSSQEYLRIPSSGCAHHFHNSI